MSSSQPTTASASVGLGTPLKLRCGITLPNRMIKAAMTENLADPATNLPSDTHCGLYARWSRGGIGAQLTGNVMVDRRYLENGGNVCIEAKDEAPERLKLYEKYAASIKDNGAVAIVQLSHSGRQCPMAVNWRAPAPSAIRLELPGLPPLLAPVATPFEMTLADIQDVIERFTTSARIAVKAGFDGCQIHGAHGYLLSSFLSPKTNHRTDQYGGSSENRRRLLKEIVVSVRAAIGDHKILCVKLNSADFQKGGFTEDESIVVIRELTPLVDFIEVSGGTYENAVMMKSKASQQRDLVADRSVAVQTAAAAPVRESTRKREAYFLDFCDKVRASNPDVVLMCSGGWRSGIAMSRALRDGEVDIIGMARPVCVAPDFPRALLASPQLAANQLESAVEDAVTLPQYSLALHTPIASLNKTAESVLENCFHQACMRRLARGEEPNINADLGALAVTKYLTVDFGRMYVYEPRKHPRRALFYASCALSVLSVFVAVKATNQKPAELFQNIANAVTKAWNSRRK